VRTVLGTLILLSVSITGSALAAEARQYMVEMALWIDGEQRGTPMVVVSPDEPASVVVSDPAGEGGWKVEVLVDPPVASEGAPAGAIWLNLAVHERRDGEWELLADTLLGVPEGREGVLSVVDSGVEQATPENSRVYLVTQASRLRPGESAP